MIYRSNLGAPDLTQYFKLKSPAVQIFGHDVPSDPDFDPGCGFWTHDEAAILFTVAKQVGGQWLDLGARFGWTTAHIAEALSTFPPGDCGVWAVDRGFQTPEFYKRFRDNTARWKEYAEVSPGFEEGVTAQAELLDWKNLETRFHGFVIDADHDAPQPTLDAIGCHKIAYPNSVILMHDFMGRPIQDAVVVLMALGWRCRIYDTPNGVALLWRDVAFVPPTHRPDPSINWRKMRDDIREQQQFPYDRTE